MGNYKMLHTSLVKKLDKLGFTINYDDKYYFVYNSKKVLKWSINDAGHILIIFSKKFEDDYESFHESIISAVNDIKKIGV